MSSELLIQSLKIITEKSQSSIEQLMRKDKPVNEKVKFVSLYLQQMKSQIFQWISNILNTGINPKEMAKKLNQLKKQTDEELVKHRLHIMLRKKLKKLKKQSFMHSVEGNENFFNEESRIHELERSVLNIEKDLNIEPEEEDHLGVSSIIEKSRMFGLEQSAVRNEQFGVRNEQFTLRDEHFSVKDEHNQSIMSDIEIFKWSQSERTQKKEENKGNIEILSKISEFKATVSKVQSIEGSSKFQSIQTVSKERISNEDNRKMKENEEKNIQESVLGYDKQKESGSSSSSALKDKSGIGIQPVKGMVMKKKKKSVYSCVTQGGTKQEMLGNLLEQCLQGENS